MIKDTLHSGEQQINEIDFQSETMEARTQWHDFFRVLSKNYAHLEFSTQQK